MPDQPPKAARRRFVLCLGIHCNQGKNAEPLAERLTQQFGDPVPAFMARQPVTWEAASCLSMCGLGPNMVVYPEGEAYHALDLAALERLLDEYLHPENQPNEPRG